MSKKTEDIKLKLVSMRNFMFLHFWALFHPIEKKVLFSSFGGKEYSGDPRSISEKLHELYPGYKIVWSFTDKNTDNFLIPDYVKKVGTKFEYLKEFSTSSAIITTNPVNAGTYKRKGQFIVQTWHGDRGFKRCLYECLDDWGVKRAVKITDNKVTDICVAASDYGESVYRNAFKYNGEILKIGMPRNDKLLVNNEKEINLIKTYLNIPPDKKILLYAPTFRDNTPNSQNPIIDISLTLEELNNKGGDWICIVRAHSASKGINIQNKNKKIIDVTKYPDMADLLLISDMLITDYSSCAGDFLIRKKPVIIAAFDKDDYENNCRNFRIPIEETGYFIAYNQNELNSIIRNNTDEDFKQNCENVLAFYETVETGKASEEICYRINKAYQTYFN